MKLAEPLLAAIAVITLVLVMSQPHDYVASTELATAPMCTAAPYVLVIPTYTMAGPNELASGSAEDVSGTR